MADLLCEVDSNVPSRRPPTKAIKTENRRKVRVLSPPIHADAKMRPMKENADPAKRLSTPPLESSLDDGDGFMTASYDDDVPMSDPVPSSPIAKAVERKEHAVVKVEEEEEDMMMEIAQAVGNESINTSGVNISGSRPAPKVLKKPSYPTPESSSPTRPPTDAIDASTWNSVTAKLNVLSSPASQMTAAGKARVEDVTEDDGTLRMFWTDYTEVNGSLCLFGKVRDRSSGAFVSAFVKIDNILRKLFFLPRVYKQSEFFSRPRRPEYLTHLDRAWSRYL
jgi:DNA polymerase alpha subunit A